ncbi:MAG: hypothetical protein KJ963_06130 [Bacteroidetes bacterium]|nr:hypothetical protein [Bacteroidota bacterium]MBU2636646.1 hypothetical protein [Bacteroidota bacterium]
MNYEEKIFLKLEVPLVLRDTYWFRMSKAHNNADPLRAIIIQLNFGATAWSEYNSINIKRQYSEPNIVIWLGRFVHLVKLLTRLNNETLVIP